MLQIPAPKEVIIELTTACNFSCKHCPVSGPTYVAKTMKRELAYRVIDSVSEFDPPPKKIQLSGHGESTILPWFSDLIEHIRARMPNTRIAFHTNGSALSDLAVQLVGSSPTEVVISMDGGSAPVFDYIRGAGNFEKTVAGLEKISQLKKEQNAPYPWLGFAVVANRYTIFDLPEIVRLAARLGVTPVGVQPLTAYDNLGTEDWLMGNMSSEEKLRARDAIDSAKQLAAELHVPFIIWNGDPFAEPIPEWQYKLKSISPEHPKGETLNPTESCGTAPAKRYKNCLDPFVTAFVNAFGRLNTCCIRLDDVEVSVDTLSLKDIWYTSVGLNHVRNSLLRGTIDAVCASCPVRADSDVPPIIPCNDA